MVHAVGVDTPSQHQHPRPFRFSLQVALTPSRRDFVELAKRTESSGFDMLVTADHLGGCLSPLVSLAVAAEATTTLRLGTMVLNNDFWLPSLLAREVATLDILSEGRVELGLGAGHAAPEYERAGVAFDVAGTRVDRLEEAVMVLRRLLDGETVDVAGAYYELRHERCDPPPIQTHLPLLVGGGGRRVHAIGARLADAIGFTGAGRTLGDGQHHEVDGFTLSSVERDVAHVRQAAGKRLDLLELQVLVQGVTVTDRARMAAEQISTERLRSLSVDDVLATPYLLVGSTEGLVDRLLDYRERFGFSHYTVRPDALDRVEPLVAALAGR